MLTFFLEKQMSDGWAVEVVTKVFGGGETSRVFYARCSDRLVAEEAVKKRISPTADVLVTAKEVVSSEKFNQMQIEIGQVGQWI